MELGKFGEIIVANGDKIEAIGRGKVILMSGESHRPIQLTLKEVLYVPNIDVNLISVKKVTENGLCVKFINKSCYLSGKFGTYLIAKDNDGVYSLLGNEQRANVVQIESECIHGWHKRLAHRNLADIKRIKNIGLNIKPCNCSDLCESCIQGKMSRNSFPQHAERKTERLECVVSDICEMPVISLGGSRYFITFTDLYSGYTEVKFMNKKSEAFEKTVHFIERTKTHLNLKPKTFRSDRGGEYLSNAMQSYLSENGIKFECTVGYAPQQNGVAERKNRTLSEAARTMLISSKLPKSYWAEALNNANDTFNSLPDEKLKSPYEKLFLCVPKYDFHEFGSDVYVKVHDHNRRKLDSKAEKMKFLGRDPNSKGYRVASSSHSIKVSRDVKFVKIPKINGT
jgi:transposase InsO family protein